MRASEVRLLATAYREGPLGFSRMMAIVVGAVTMSLLLLSSAGLYALMSFVVARRRREIGIRSALGAPTIQLLGAIFSRALGQVAAGGACGLLAAFLFDRYFSPVLEGMSFGGGIGPESIPGIVPAAALFMTLIGLLAVIGPARRALRVAPTEALREG